MASNTGTQFTGYDLQWISQHAAQSYPLDDSAYAQGSSGILPMSFLLDIQIRIPKSKITALKSKFYVMGLIDNIDTYTLIIGCQYAQNQQFACLKAHGIPKTIGIGTDIQSRYFVLVADTQKVPEEAKNIVSRFTGTVYIGVTQYTNIPTLDLSYEQGKISPVCVQSTQGLDAISVNGKQIHGIVSLQAGKGIKLTETTSGQTTYISVAIDKDTVYSGMSSIADIIQEVKSKLGNPIQKINNVSPDDTGAITIAGVDCVTFQPTNASDHIITVSNTCSKPCCGSTYSQALKAQIQVIKQQQSILRDYFVTQSNNINYIQASLATVIGSK